MIQITLNIPDHKPSYFMRLIENLGFVQIADTEEIASKQELIDEAKQAVEEMKLIQTGKLTPISAKDLLNEL